VPVRELTWIGALVAVVSVGCASAPPPAAQDEKVAAGAQYLLGSEWALRDLAGTPLGGGVDFAQTLNVLPGDVSDDSNVASNDMVLVNIARYLPYNVIDDIDGDGVVDANDVNLVRARIGTHLP